MKKSTPLLASALLLSLAVPLQGASAVETHNITLTHARVSDLADGKVSVSMDASGDLRGMLTLTLDVNNGVATGGDWALVVAYVQDLNPDGTVATEPEAPESEEGPHHEYINFVNEGTLGGPVSDITLNLNTDGTVAGVSSAQLSIVSTSLNFTDATGTGTVVINDARDYAASNGSLVLPF